MLKKRLSEELARIEPPFQRASRKSEELRLAQLAAAGPFGVGSPFKRSKSRDDARNGEPRSAVDRTSDLLAAWGAGRFNDAGNDTAFEEFFAQDAVFDSSAGAHSGVAEFKTYAGIEGAKAWFEFVGSLEFEGMEMAHVAGPTPGEVWLRFEAAKHVSKKTGKGTAYSAMTVLFWEGGKCGKVVSLPFLPARTAAILSEEDVPVPPMATLPTFEPHPEPMEAYEEAMARWSSGELSKPEVLEKYVAADAVNDVADSALPCVLKAYEGSAAVREWFDHFSANWDLSNASFAPVAGLKPGCVTHRMTCDVTHKKTGKEAKGVQAYVELAYNAAGQFVYSRHYWLNAPVLASIYLTDV